MNDGCIQYGLTVAYLPIQYIYILDGDFWIQSDSRVYRNYRIRLGCYVCSTVAYRVGH